MSSPAPIIIDLIRSSSPTFTIAHKPAKSSSSNGQIKQSDSLSTTRRNAIISFSFLSSLLLPLPLPATAFSIGISGPKDWLRDQKKKSSKFLLAPIDATRNSLRTAYLLLTKSDNDDKDSEEIQRLLVSASRDCVPDERSSFVTFQASTGVEVCTFQLILKNAASLLGDKDPVKLEAEEQLRDLIRYFTSLSAQANKIDIQLPSSRKQVVGVLMDTISSLDKFEEGVKNCLEI
ncbi:uncharacterized protein LOC124938586 [Impatiens glandulifera]|uniref:uncharacterized protein LOC124938586 n=1 Tax=Impatiens glandulifera TaxID=253017 RepID=UPI001FB0E5AA|nr:uncharacterized protein LOC124938586 [Impatiens glandulifera]